MAKMTGRTKFIVSVSAIFFSFFLFVMLQVVHLSRKGPTVRSEKSLLNQYYRLSQRHPEGAKRALELILLRDPTNKNAVIELGFWYVRQGQMKEALEQFEYAHKLYPDNPTVTAQLKLLDCMFKKLPEEEKLTVATTTTTVAAPKKISTSKMSTSKGTQSKRDLLLNEFYNTKKDNPQKAWSAMNKLLKLYPEDVVALKEAGYYALGEGKKELSVSYFDRAYHLTHDPYLALQIGYILDGLGKKRLAYGYFDKATQTENLTERLKAELAKTNLRGTQFQFLPEPYYFNILFYPFYQSRFKLMIYPLIARAGIMLNKAYNFSAYISYMRTSDNKSSSAGQLPQIYEDDVAITSLGLRGSPIKQIPLTAFIEAGKAVDLVYRNRGRWRNDFRTGFIFYNDWGKEARYTFHPTFSAVPNMDIYADLIYYSRFLDTIGTMRLRPGLEVFRYGSTSVNVYIKGFLVEDRNRLFYNNIFEYGPSIAFTPYDRYNVTLRYENLRGYYMPANSSSPNPYSKTYHNSMIFLDMYASF